MIAINRRLPSVENSSVSSVTSVVEAADFRNPPSNSAIPNAAYLLFRWVVTEN